MEFAALQIGTDDRILAAKGPALNTLELWPEEIIGTPARKAFEKVDRLDEAIENARRGKRCKERVKVRDSTFEVVFRPADLHLDDRETEPTVVLGLKEIGEKTETKAELSTDALFGHYLRQAPGALWITDGSLRFVYVNGRSLDTLGLDRERLIGLSPSDVVGGEESPNDIIAAHDAALHGENQSLDYCFRGRWLQVSLEPLREDDKIKGVIGTAVDITHKKRQELKLRKSQAQLEEAQRLAHVGSFEWDIKSDRVDWTDELYRIYGVDPQSFEGNFKSFLQHVHPDDRQKTLDVLEEAMDSLAPFSYEHRVVAADAETKVLHTQGQVIGDAHGNPEKIVGSCWDITDRARTEDRLRETVSTLESTLNATADGVLVVDRDGRVTSYNKQFLNMWRIPNELAERRDDDKLLDYVQSQLKNPAAFLQEIRYLYGHRNASADSLLEFKDGRVFERVSIPQTIDSEYAGRVWSFRDITDKEHLKRKQEFLLEASRLLSSLDVDHALEAIAKLSVPICGKGCIIDLLDKQKCLRIDSSGETSGWVTRNEAPDYPHEVLEGHSTVYTNEGKHDTRFSVPMTYQGDVVGVFTFVGQYHRNYSEADRGLAESLVSRASLSYENARLYERARDALVLRDEFLSIAAHEIRGPIFSISLAAETMQSGTLPQEKWPRLLEIITSESHRLRRFVEDLLNIGRIRSGKFVFQRQRVDLVDVVQKTIDALSQEIERSGSDVAFDAPERLVGFWDPDRLSQVVRNLLSNALKFGEARPVEVILVNEGESAAIHVRDRGIGVPEGMLEEIFDPFRRAVSMRNFGGLGLGLYIVKTIVEGMGGTVQAGHREGGGADFVIRVPRETNETPVGPT